MEHLHDLHTRVPSQGNLSWLLNFNNTGQESNGTDGAGLEENATYHWLYLLVICFIVTGVTGNVLVCLAISLDRKLQNVTNYFLLSLSIADLLVSLVVMPFGAIYGFLGYWPFSIEWCNIYVTCDVLACSCSIMHMCSISLGRYLGVRNPIQTRRTSKKTVMIRITLCWLLSMIITSPITVLALVDPDTIMPEPRSCIINNRYYQIFGSMCAFYVPMLIMVVSYILTVYLLHQKAEFFKNEESGRFKHRGSRNTLSYRTNHTSPHLETSGDDFLTEPISHSRYHLAKSHRNYSQCDQGTQTEDLVSHRCGPFKLRRLKLRLSTVSTKFLNTKKRSNLPGATAVANEQKASKVLGLVFFTFVVCWSPFFILNIISATSPDFHIAEIIKDTCLWLGYVSSTINPIIYTIFNHNFRSAFVRLIKCNCKPQSRHLRSISFHDAITSTYSVATLARTPSPFIKTSSGLPTSFMLDG